MDECLSISGRDREKERNRGTKTIKSDNDESIMFIIMLIKMFIIIMLIIIITMITMIIKIS
jgi:hypothetical protein